jgi:signal peptidase II
MSQARPAMITLAVTLAADQASKWAIVQGMNLRELLLIEVWPPYLTLRMAWNTGVNFGLFAGGSEMLRWGLVVLAVAVSVWVWRVFARPGCGGMSQISAGLLVGGALGNAIDRAVYGAVADFLNMSCCGIANPYAFNIADIAIFVGVVGLVIWGGGPRRDETANR